MILHYMSASRIKTYLQCPNKYHEQYENKVKGDATHLTFGTLMHTVFERWYQENLDIVEIYNEEWAKAEIADPEFYRDGFDIIDNFLRMNDKDSHIPLGFEIPFAINILTNEVYDTDSVDWSNSEEVRAFIKTLEELDAPIIFGFIDRAEYDQYRDILRIVDYKTSRIAMTQYESDEDVQMSMYDLVASLKFPEYGKVVQELQYVRLGVPVRTSRTDEQRYLFQEWLLSIYNKIKSDTMHEASLNKYCGWCDAKGKCSTYQEFVNGEAEEYQIDSMSDDDMQNQLEKIKVHLKILDGRKKEIEGALKGKLKSTDNAGIQTSSGELYLTPNLRTSYDVETIIKNFPPELLGNLLSVKKTEVDELAKKDSKIMDALQSTRTDYYIEPTLRKGKKK